MIGSCKGCARMREPGRGLVGGSTSSAHWVVRGVIGSRFSRLTDGQARTGDLCYRGGVVSKPAAPDEVVLSKGLSTAMDMDGYGVEERAVRKSMLPDEDAEPTSGVGPAGPGGGGLSKSSGRSTDSTATSLGRIATACRSLLPRLSPSTPFFRNARENSDDVG